MPSAAKIRTVARIVESVRTVEGGGFVVRRPFPTGELRDLDPFLLLDEMGPVDYAPGEAKGAPDHPHRGFETVTYLLAGRMQHRDSHGHAGMLGPGDVQWMTAGSGVVHSEMPADDFTRRGGRMHGFQLWVNLPRRDKRIRPRYQEVPAARIPSVSLPDDAGSARVVAGEIFGTHAVVETRVPILYVHLTLRPGARIAPAVLAGHTTFAYVFGGAGRFGPPARARAAGDGSLVVFAADGDAIDIEADGGAAPLEMLLLAGTPLGEPVARYGPFVMNTEADIIEAIDDFRAGRMGTIAAD